MKKFLLTVLIFLFPLVFLFVFGLIFPIILDDEVLNDTLESKITELKIDTTKITIVIAGDSRAERQLVPKTIMANTGINTINIATTSCDLVTFVSAIKKKYASASNIIFIISASSWQINDGATDLGYLSMKAFQQLSLLQKFMIYKNNLSEMIRMYKSLILSGIKYCFYRLLHKKNGINFSKDDNIIKNLGFYEIKGSLNSQSDSINLMNKIMHHPWYKNINNNGVRWLIFQKALFEIGNMKSLFIIYQPPISDYWRVNTENSFIDRAEIEYSKKLSAEIKKYRNVIFFDFYNNGISALNDNMYYDPQHLNGQGAEEFSIVFSQKILEVYQKSNWKNRRN